MLFASVKNRRIKKFYTESKVLGLLMLQLEQMQINSDEAERTLIKADDLDKLYQAKVFTRQGLRKSTNCQKIFQIN
ncbi:hypothetical protein ABIC84_000867 [Mucilaginibacter sp. 3215]